MNEQVMVYEVKSSANVNADKLFSPDRKYFYWNDTAFKNLKIGDYVFVVNIHSNIVLFSKLDFDNISVSISNDKTSFSDLGKEYLVSGKWEKFIRLSIIKELSTPDNWKWKSLGSSETTYLNGPRINTEKSENRISNITQLKELTSDPHICDVLNNCFENYSTRNPKITPITNNDKKEIEKVALKELPMANKRIVAHVHQYIASVGFQYQYEEIANFYLALKAKPFVILAGISGTGKTQLPRKFAEAIGMSKEQVIQVPVRPDWTDGSDLLGYTGLDGQFKPKDLTLAIQRAYKNPDKPYFFILDEMNLARVEHYFSDFLSVIETREKKDGKITTDSILRDEVIQNAANPSEFKTMGWPQNLYLIGTVNMDETTHAFSKKVLDRANSIEMNEVDLGWITRSSTSDKPLEDIGNSFFATEFIGSLDLSDEDKNTLQSEMELLKKVNAILQKADLHFAYRVRDEVAFYLILNKKYELIETNAAMDFQLVQKVLPRIHGSSERVQTVLVELLNLLEGKNFRSTNFEYAQIEGKIDINNLKYKRSSKKILFMLKRFDDDRFTSFWL